MSGMNLIHVVTGNDFQCLFWGVAIVIFIVSQIAKSKKKYDKSAPQQGAPPQANGDPAEELRRFLEGLGQAPPQPQAPPPAPVAPPPVPRRAAARPVKARPAAPPPVRIETVVSHEPAPVSAATVSEETTPGEAEVLARYRAEMATSRPATKAVSKWREILGTELRGGDRNTLRKAFVLREVLGPPTALRRREVVYPLV